MDENIRKLLRAVQRNGTELELLKALIYEARECDREQVYTWAKHNLFRWTKTWRLADGNRYAIVHLPDSVINDVVQNGRFSWLTEKETSRQTILEEARHRSLESKRDREIRLLRTAPTSVLIHKYLRPGTVCIERAKHNYTLLDNGDAICTDCRDKVTRDERVAHCENTKKGRNLPGDATF